MSGQPLRRGKKSFDGSLTMNDPLTKLGRLAMRVEKGFWRAYYALPDTMEGAILLGSIRMAFVEEPKAKEAFMYMMKACVGMMLEEVTGHKPSWPNPPVSAPEHERSKE